MRIKNLLWICGGLLVLAGCRQEFEDHYHKVGDASIGMSVTQVLEERGEFRLFLEMIRRADLERTLTQSGLYTCFAPRDRHVQEWLDKNGWTVQTMPLRTINQFVNYHFIKGMKYYYDFEKKYQDAVDWDDMPEMYGAGLIVDSREAGKAYPAKAVRVFTDSYLTVHGDDYKKMRLVEPGDFMVEDVAVSATDRDIPTANGVIHVLDGSLMLTPRMDEVMNADPDLSVVMSWFNRFAGSELLVNDGGGVDSVEMKYYNVNLRKDSRVLNIADEAQRYTALMPTNEAMNDYFKEHLVPEEWTMMDSVPDIFVIPFLRSLVAYTGTMTWGLSDIDRNSPYFTSYTGDILPLKNNIGSLYAGSLVSTNGLVYKLNRVPEIPMMTSVEAGFYFRYKHYREWNKMVDKNKLLMSSFGTSMTYQHTPKIVLIQPDESVVWKDGGIEGYEEKYQDTLAWRMNAGFLNGQLNDGDLEHRFYQGPRGAVLCEKQGSDWVFEDYEGNVVELLSQKPVYETEDGSAIFEVDGLLEQLTFGDTTKLVYRKYIEKEGSLNNFKLLMDKAGSVDLLNKLGSAYYTVFAPDDEALTYEKVSALSEEEAKAFFRKYVVEGRRIFTDGFTQGEVTTLGNLRIKISGSWDSFQLSTQYSHAGISGGKCNLQGSNGVLHVIDHLLE